ncbi:MAG: phosphoribosylanthranilate isomerase [Actinobacteria bacterium]|nr:phosphoribosylanthranilate isomerase [Actinomycetota bacterium]
MFVKVCGITSEDDALLAVAMGADAVGFIFAPSRRRIAVARARDIVARLPREVITVGVFQDETPARVVETVNAAGLRAAQLHGHESPDMTRWVRERVGLVIKAFPGGSPAIDGWDTYGADVLMIDAPNPGSGEIFDWSLAEDAPKGARVLLAGGLTPENVTSAIEKVRPWGVDAASGLETEAGPPGRKDPVKVRRFVAAARAAEPPGFRSESDSPYDWTSE